MNKIISNNSTITIATTNDNDNKNTVTVTMSVHWLNRYSLKLYTQKLAFSNVRS